MYMHIDFSAFITFRWDSCINSHEQQAVQGQTKCKRKAIFNHCLWYLLESHVLWLSVTAVCITNIIVQLIFLWFHFLRR